MTAETVPPETIPANAVVAEGDVATVKVWQLPVRIIHWTIFTCVVVLSLTGFYIAFPFIAVGTEPAFLMGWMRSVHALFAWIFIAAILARLIWMFTGNRWARWDQFIPVSKERRQCAWEALKYYLFVRREPPRVVGHNPLAGLTYSILILMFLVQIFTGLALKALDSPDSYLWTISGWVFDLFPITMVRLFHHFIMWLTWGFVVHHVYSAWLVDWEERSGLVSSILTGYKRLPVDRL